MVCQREGEVSRKNNHCFSPFPIVNSAFYTIPKYSTPFASVNFLDFFKGLLHQLSTCCWLLDYMLEVQDASSIKGIATVLQTVVRSIGSFLCICCAYICRILKLYGTYSMYVIYREGQSAYTHCTQSNCPYSNNYSSHTNHTWDNPLGWLKGHTP